MMAQRMALPADYESFGDGSNSAEPLFGGNTGYGPASMDGRSSANQTEYSLTPRFAEDVSNLEQYETPVDQFDFVHGRFPERLGDNIAPNLLGPGINRCQISFGNFNDLAADQSANNPESLYTLTGSSDDNGISRPQDMRHHHEPGITASIFNPDHGSNGTSQWDGGYCNLDDPFPFLWTPNETLDSEYVPPQRLTPRRPDVSASQLTTTSTSNNQSSRLLFQSSGAEISYLFHNRIDAQSYHTPAERSQNVQTASSSFIVASRDETFTFGPDISGPQLLQQSQYNPWSMELRPKNGSSQQSQLNSGLCPSHSFAETTRAQSDIFTIVHPHYTQHHAADRVAPVQVISATCSSTPNAYQGHVPIQPKSVKFGPSIPNNLRHVRSRQTRSDRRPLTKQGRENARAVKKMGGACILCKRNKLLCSPAGPCEACVSKLGKPELAKNICFRRGLEYFRTEIVDLFDIRARNSILTTELYGPRQILAVGDRITTGGKECAFFPTDVTLTIEIRLHENCGLKSIMVGSDGVKPEISSYAIDHNKLPTVDQLDHWGRNLMVEYYQLADFQPPIKDKFLFAYCNATSVLTMRRIVDLTIRMVSLSTWLDECHPTTSPENIGESLFGIQDGQIERRLSNVARNQLRSIAAKGIEETELAIFSAFDHSMEKFGPNPQDAAIIGLCLRRLALIYRRMLKRYKIFFHDSNVNRRREKSQAMYEALTTSYSLVYRGAASPYSPEWRVEDHRDAFGNDDDLADLFLKLTLEDKRFCEKNRDDEDDIHVTKLFLERRERKGKRPGAPKK